MNRASDTESETETDKREMKTRPHMKKTNEVDHRKKVAVPEVGSM